MTEEKGATLRYAPTFCSSYFMNGFYKQDILGNIISGDFFHLFGVMILKQQSHFHAIIAECAFTIITHDKGVVQLGQPF